MTAMHEFDGPDGMTQKIRLLARNCDAATRGLSRTLLIAVSMPDPLSTPDCEHAGPRGIRIQTLDKGMTSTDIAVLMGTIYGMLDTIEDGYTHTFGEDFRESVDTARGTYGHAWGMSVVPVVPLETKAWKSREIVQKR